jgi:hypothetical protein
LGSLGTAATNRPIVPAPGDYDDGEIGGMMIGRGNGSTRRKPAPLPLLTTTNPTCCPEANPGRRGGRPATNRLSNGRANLRLNALCCDMPILLLYKLACFLILFFFPLTRAHFLTDLWAVKFARK